MSAADRPPRVGVEVKVSDDPLNYQLLTEDALRSVVRKALNIAAERGLNGQHHFYITFRTDYPGAELADHLRQKHAKEMTIVLQHQFWGLEVGDSHFAVTLSFNGQHERLVVPWASISAFVDPSVQFGLQFSVPEPQPASAPAALPTPLPAASAPVGAPPPDAGARVVTLDAFRKSDARKK